MIIIVMIIIIVLVIAIVIIIAIVIVVIIMIARLPQIKSQLLTKIGHSQIIRVEYIKANLTEHIKTMVPRTNNTIPTIVDFRAEGLSPFTFSRRQCYLISPPYDYKLIVLALGTFKTMLPCDISWISTPKTRFVLLIRK